MHVRLAPVRNILVHIHPAIIDIVIAFLNCFSWNRRIVCVDIHHHCHMIFSVLWRALSRSRARNRENRRELPFSLGTGNEPIHAAIRRRKTNLVSNELGGNAFSPRSHLQIKRNCFSLLNLAVPEALEILGYVSRRLDLQRLKGSPVYLRLRTRKRHLQAQEAWLLHLSLDRKRIAVGQIQLVAVDVVKSIVGQAYRRRPVRQQIRLVLIGLDRHRKNCLGLANVRGVRTVNLALNHTLANA